jgi:hypothetical protein
MARPQKQVTDYAQIEKLAEIGCSDEEIAGVIGVGKRTFVRMKQRDENIVLALDRGKSNLNVKLRRFQIEMALSGSVPMLIHLGKTVLGQGQPKVEETKENPLAQFLPRAETLKNLPKSADEPSD